VLLLDGVLHARLAQVLEHGGREGRARLLGLLADRLLLEGEHAVGGERFDGEGTGDADGLLVLVGLVEEELPVGVAGDRGIDLLA